MLEFLRFIIVFPGLDFNYGLTIYLILRKGPLSLLLRRFSEIFGQWLVSRDSSWQYVQRTRVSRCPQCLQCSFPVPRHFRPPTWKTASPTPLEINYFQNWSISKIFFYKKWCLNVIILNDFFRKSLIIFDIEMWLWKSKFLQLSESTLSEKVQKNFSMQFLDK